MVINMLTGNDMSEWTKHLRGLAKLESNHGKKVAFDTSASLIDQYEVELNEANNKIKKLEFMVEDGLCDLNEEGRTAQRLT